MGTDNTAADLAALLPSWKLALTADRRAAQTIDAYTTGVRLFLEWCAAHGHAAALDRATVRAWITHLLERGAAAATARTRQMALKRFSAWLEEEGELATDELVGLRPPKLDTAVTQHLSEDQCAAMVSVCNGKAFIDRRDEAILRLLLETGMRAREALGLQLDDIDLAQGLAHVRRGKGGTGRLVPFGPQTGRALDRYLRMRRTHRLADNTDFWLGGGGQAFTYHALDKALKSRAQRAGVAGFHIHLCRHTAASRWLSAGGSENGLMAVAGWRSRQMLDRYTRSSATERAAAEARKLNLGGNW